MSSKILDPVICLQDYIKIRTDHPNPDYDSAINYLVGLVEYYGFDYEVKELTEKNKALLVYYTGSDKSLDPILLNSHIDVVQVEEDKWAHNPFEGKIVTNRIGPMIIHGQEVIKERSLMFGRGTQDMKSIGIQHIHALAKLKLENFKPKRTIILSFVPDEEIMGFEGMYLLTKHLPPISFAIDEGVPSEDDSINLYYGERKQWWIKLESFGEAGHGSKYVNDNAFLKLYDISTRIVNYGKDQKAKLENDNTNLADVVTININQMSGGNSSSYNVIPSTWEAGLDVRIPPSINLVEFEKMISDWCDDCGVKYSFVNNTNIDYDINNITDQNNYWAQLVKNYFEDKGIDINLDIFQASTDAQFLRKLGIPTIGMSLIRNTKVLLHDHNEYIPIESFLEGIDMYVELLKKIDK